MGGKFWSYFVPYRADVEAAMLALQEAEFEAGRYHSMRDDDASLPTPESIEDLRENYLDESGSRSILDMMYVADDADEALGVQAEMRGELPEEMHELMGGEMPAFCTVVRVAEGKLVEFFGTAQPTREMVEGNYEYMEGIERGCGVYFVIYKDGKASEIHFAGYSFD